MQGKLTAVLLLFCLINNTNAQTNTMRKVKLNTLFTINLKETVLIDDELELTFFAHSHKNTFAGTVSPLMITLNYHHLFKKINASKTYLLEGKTPFIWRWEKYLFVITAYKYDEMMEMKICRDNETE